MRALLLLTLVAGSSCRTIAKPYAEAPAADTTPALPVPAMEAASNATAHSGTAIISGRVVKDGKPVPFYGLMVQQQAQSWVEQPIAVRVSDGKFRFKGVKGGSWNLVLVGPGFARTVKAVTLKDATLNELGDIAVDTGLRVSGRVLDGQSKPIVGATIATAAVEQRGATYRIRSAGTQAADTTLPDAARGLQRTTTDLRGGYVLEGVVRPARVEASLNDRVVSKDLPEGEGPLSLDFEFK